MVRLTLKNKKEVLLLIAKEGESLRGFSKKIGVSCAYVSQIINGKRNPSPIIANKISKGLNVNIEDIFLIQTSVDNGQKEKVI